MENKNKDKDIASYRTLRVSNLIKEVLYEELAKGKVVDSRLTKNNFFITKINLSKDLKVANCYIRTYIMEKNNNEGKIIVSALNECSKILRYNINPKLKLRNSPELRFFYDASFDNSYAVDAILNKIKTE
jgi:ribosome-binding factor A